MFPLIWQLDHLIRVTQEERCCWCQSWRDDLCGPLPCSCRRSEAEGGSPDWMKGWCRAAPQTGGYSLHTLEEAERDRCLEQVENTPCGHLDR